MKNGYNSKEYAYTLAIDALQNAHSNKFGELDGLSDPDIEKVRHQLELLRIRLADHVKLDILPSNS
jgi:hypothetical protein